MEDVRSDIIRDAEGFETPDLHSSSAEYAARFAGGAGKWFLQVQERATLGLLGDLPAGTVLDVGGGHGQTLPVLVRVGHRVTVVGSTADCTTLIRPMMERGEVAFAVAPLTRLPFAKGDFDVALSYRMLMHLDDWRGLVAELCRVSRRSVLVDFPARRGWNALTSFFFGAKKRIEGNTRPYTLFRGEEVAAEFRRHGFAPAGAAAQFFWPMALHRMHGSASLARGLEALPRKAGLTARFGSPIIARFDRREE